MRGELKMVSEARDDLASKLETLQLQQLEQQTQPQEIKEQPVEIPAVCKTVEVAEDSVFSQLGVLHKQIEDRMETVQSLANLIANSDQILSPQLPIQGINTKCTATTNDITAVNQEFPEDFTCSKLAMLKQQTADRISTLQGLMDMITSGGQLTPSVSQAEEPNSKYADLLEEKSLLEKKVESLEQALAELNKLLRVVLPLLSVLKVKGKSDSESANKIADVELEKRTLVEKVNRLQSLLAKTKEQHDAKAKLAFEKTVEIDKLRKELAANVNLIS